MTTPKSAKNTPKKQFAAKKQKSDVLQIHSEAKRGADLDLGQLQLAVDAVKKLNTSNREDSSSLLLADDSKLSLQITGIKLPRDNRRQLIRIPLPHCPLPDPYEVCLIVRDEEKGIRPDHEATKLKYKQLLAEKGAGKLVSRVMPLRELKVEYKEFEQKTALVHAFDRFLVDNRILRLVPKLLGKAFYKRKRFPVGVDLRKAELEQEIQTALNTVILPLSYHGTSAQVTVGNGQMESTELAENVAAAAEVLSRRYPGGWKNIRMLCLKGELTKSVPVHVSTESCQDVGFVDSDAPKRIVRQTVEDELSTQPGMVVAVTPFGSIKVTKGAEASEEWMGAGDNEDSDDDGSESETEQDRIDKARAKKRKAEEKKVAKEERKKAKKEAKKTKVDSEDEDDEELQDTELKYMQKVAEEEQEMEAKMKENQQVEQQSESNDEEEASGDEGEGEEEEEEEDVSGGEEADDSEEAEDDDDDELDEKDIVRDLDDDDDDSGESDGENDLYVQKSAQADDSDSE